MSAVTNNPVDQNFLQGSKFSIGFARLPYIQFFVTAINIPGLSVANGKQATPFRDGPVPGMKMQYDPLSITFNVDEPMYSWTSIRDWMSGYAIPESFEQYKGLTLQQRLQMGAAITPQYSDIIIQIYSNKNNPLFTLNFSQAFPIELSGINLDVTDDGTMIKKATAQFQFTNYDIQRMSS